MAYASHKNGLNFCIIVHFTHAESLGVYQLKLNMVSKIMIKTPRFVFEVLFQKVKAYSAALKWKLDF